MPEAIQPEMESVIPERTPLQLIALTVADFKTNYEIAKGRYKEAEEELMVAMKREQSPVVIVKDSLNYQHRFAYETSEKITHKQTVARTTERVGKDAS